MKKVKWMCELERGDMILIHNDDPMDHVCRRCKIVEVHVDHLIAKDMSDPDIRLWIDNDFMDRVYWA